ncbi:uncharacterized protein LOC113005609 [Solenopsis invicta]|uniref:uncharacterized protein LOC113005609 n=1 Tax=Solenopsis invicta TaxID=13686 RepID=UPI000E33F253|nr:uncharacterized protein LOC113005609 [Solenopsis invicta]
MSRSGKYYIDFVLIGRHIFDTIVKQAPNSRSQLHWLERVTGKAHTTRRSMANFHKFITPKIRPIESNAGSNHLCILNHDNDKPVLFLHPYKFGNNFLKRQKYFF